MADKFKRYESEDGSQVDIYFFCPGCGCEHPFRVKGGNIVWQWNGDLVNGTFNPSLLCNPNDPSTRCHSFVREGKVEFLGDCYHKLKGQTVEIPEWED